MQVKKKATQFSSIHVTFAPSRSCHSNLRNELLSLWPPVLQILHCFQPAHLGGTQLQSKYVKGFVVSHIWTMQSVQSFLKVHQLCELQHVANAELA